jgi:hypothetical protein
MADPNKNFFPDKELEDKNAILDRKVEEIMSQINEKLDLESITKQADEQVETINQKLIDEGLMEPDLLSTQERSYVNTLPQDYKDSTLRYLDIFRDNPDVVKDYISVVQKYGSIKAAKEAGESNILLYPNKRLKFVADNPELFTEKTLDRLTAFELQGSKSYDLAYREDEIAKAKQKEYYGKTSTKIISGLAEPVLDTGREITRWAAMLVDAVGPDNAVNALDYIENNWPRADDIQYPNKSQPFNQDSAIQELTDELTQFGIDTFLGGKILKGFGFIAKKAMPGTTKKVVERLAKKKPKVDKSGKTLTDQFGNIKYASSIAQKMGFWGLPVKYGIGRSITADEEKPTFTEGFGFMPPIDKEKFDKLSNSKKAAEILKRKLIHGAEGTVLIGGLTLAAGKIIGVAGATAKGIYKTTAAPFNTLVLNPVSKILASRKTGVPQTVNAIKKGGGFITQKIPPLEKWGFFSTTMGPMSERLMAAADKFILTPLRVRGPFTKEAKQIMLTGERMTNKYKKSIGFDLKRIDRAIYNLLNKGFGNKVFTTSSVSAGKQYWDDVLKYLKGEIPLKNLPEVIRQPVVDIQKTIEALSKKIKPYVKNEEIKKEIVDGMGKYLTTSYEIFQGSFKPDQTKITAATNYFVDLIKKTNKKYKNVKEGDKLWPEISRLASQKVDEIIQYGKEGASPIKRMQAITSLVTPDKILAKKQTLPKVIEDLMGKINNPITVITDTVTQQAQLLSHLFTHKQILKEGLRSGWIVTDPEKFAMEGVQKLVAKSLVPIQTIARTSNIDIAKIYTRGKKGNYFTTPEIANGIASDALATDFLLQWAPYKAFLAAKTTAQLSKTVLSLMTQTRNFETAMFFSLMQGHIGAHASVLDAMKYVFGEVVGSGRINPNVMRKKLKEYSDEGIIDSSVVAGEVEAIIGDIAANRFANTDQLFKYMLQNPIFRKATEFYQASDNVWKAYGYEFTKSQMLAAIPIRGLTTEAAKKLGYVVESGRTVPYTWQDLVSNQFREVFKMKWNPLNLDGSEKTYGKALKEIAAKYIVDVYPNYNMVPSLVRNWRRLPVGNFVAFRSETIRNIYNTLAYGTRELTSSNPFLRQMGARRLIGLNATLYGFQEGLFAATGAITNIDEDFIRKYQRWFSPWYDKNSTIYPISKIRDDKTFWTLNWSREQPFEGVQDAVEAVTSKMFNTDQSDDAIYTRFFKGFFYDYDEKKKGGFTLLFEPFLEEAILTEAILDITPKSFGVPGARGGETKTGSIIFDMRNDSFDVILGKSVAHLIDAINPTTFKNVSKVLKAAEGDLTKSADKYNTTNELLKLFLGLGAKKENPINSITYVINDFTGRITSADKDFKRDTTNPQKILEDPFLLPKEFNDLQMNKYREYSRAYEFVKFLQDDLKLSRYEIVKELRNRRGFSQVTINMLLSGKFNASNLPPLEVTSIYPKMLERIKKNNPEKYGDLKLTDIFDRSELIGIKNKWMRVPLGLDGKQLEHWFLTGELLEKEPIEVEPQSSIIPEEKTTQVSEAITIPNNVPVETADVSQEVVKTAALPNNINKDTGLTSTEEALLSNTEKALRRKQRNVTT